MAMTSDFLTLRVDTFFNFWHPVLFCKPLTCESFLSCESHLRTKSWHIHIGAVRQKCLSHPGKRAFYEGHVTFNRVVIETDTHARLFQFFAKGKIRFLKRLCKIYLCTKEALHPNASASKSFRIKSGVLPLVPRPLLCGKIPCGRDEDPFKDLRVKEKSCCKEEMIWLTLKSETFFEYEKIALDDGFCSRWFLF